MIHDFLTYINKNNLVEASKTTLLAVSGGRDSVAMVSLFAEAGLDFAIAHCNFQLRGLDSDLDEAFCRDLAQKQGVIFHSIKFETKTLKKSVSTQMIARKLRYEWFEELLKTNFYAAIATAHHLNDSLETVLLNLVKGTGIDGLKGISPKNGNIIRPLLFANREKIDAFVEAKNLSFREDASNETTDYQRNKIRLNVIPILKTINPNLENTFQHTLERLNATANIIKKEADNLIVNHRISIENLLAKTEPLLLLSEVIKTFGFNYQQAISILEACRQPETKVFLSVDFQIIKDRFELIIEPKLREDFKEIFIQKGQDSIKTPLFNLEIKEYAINEIEISPNKNMAFLDAEKLTFPLQLRRWKHGDSMTPLGMQKRKTISDMLINAKVEASTKKNQLVLVSNNEIAWLIGMKLSESFKINEKTKRMLVFVVT